MESFFSSIQPKLKRYLIQRGLFFSLPGFFLLFYMGIFLSTSSLEKWGVWGFTISFMCISFGMIPYRRITQIETNPYRLSIKGHILCLTYTKKREVTFPIHQIKQLTFVQRKSFYGIRLHLTNEKHFLLPYFTASTFKLLSEYLPLSGKD